jgi:uncharacterized protein HemY
MLTRAHCPTGAAALDAYDNGDYQLAEQLLDQARDHGTLAERLLVTTADRIAYAAYATLHHQH